MGGELDRAGSRALDEIRTDIERMRLRKKRAAGSQKEPSHRVLNDGPVKSTRSTFDVFDITGAKLLIVDNNVWQDTRVDDGIGYFYDSSVAKVAQLSFRDLAGYFEEIEILMPNAKKDPFDWEIAHFNVGLYPIPDRLVEVVFRLDYDLEFWAKDYSVADLASAIEGTISKHDCPFTYWQQDESTVIHGFGVSIEMSAEDLVQETLGKEEELAHVTQRIRTELNEREEHSVKLAFDFPSSIKTPCEQYLMYFVQFLSDLGIEAKAELKENARTVLFSVTPEDERQALEKIREALQIYLGLPVATNFAVAASHFHDVAVSQLKANLLHLQSQIMLAQAAIEMKNATIDAKEERISLLEERIDLRAFRPRQHLVEAEAGKEDLVRGIVAVKKWDYKCFEIDFPELLRKLKRKLR
jgi:hypothetical protein